MAPPDVTSSQGRGQTTAHAGDAVSAAAFGSRNALRRELRQRRNQLSTAQRQQAADAIAGHLLAWRGFRQARRIASYYSVGAEVSTTALNLIIRVGTQALYLPCLPVRRPGRLIFRRVTETTQWRLNGHHIPEPAAAAASPIINPAFTDIILVPLVGFDAQGNRMGMGAGYYDRTLNFRRHRQHWQRPQLIGLAYNCQQVDALPIQPWDVPLDAIITETGIITPA